MNKNITEKAKSGLIWSTVERFSSLAIQFLISIVLARLIGPRAYGVMGMIAVFIVLAQTLVDSGLGASLIQNNNPSKEDYKTVFTVNLILSLLIYFILFSLAPLISDFYNQPILINIIRVFSITVVINSLSIVPRSSLLINLNFKKLTVINLVSAVLSGSIAIFYALQGLGVWALVLLLGLKSLFTSILLLTTSGVHLELGINIPSFKKLYKFGYKMLFSSLLNVIVGNISEILIGKNYKTVQLGYYSKAKELSLFSSGIISSIIDQVTFPIFSNLRKNGSDEKLYYSKIIKLVSFISFPSIVLLAILARPIIIILYGDEWVDMSILLSLMAISRILIPIKSLNMNYIKSIGRADLFLKMEMLQAPFYILAIFASISFGLKSLVISFILVEYVFFFVSMYFPFKFLKLSFLRQFKYIYKPAIGSVVMTLILLFLLPYIVLDVFKLIFGVIVGLFSYVVCMLLLKEEICTGLFKKLKFY